MSAWQYTAYNSAGRRVRGVLVADSESDARGLLRKNGLFPEDLVPTRVRDRPWLSLRPGTRRAGVEDLAAFTRQMAVLVGAELPIEEALKVYTQSEGRGVMRRVAAELRTRVRDGFPLSRALAVEKGIFPGYYVAAVAAGESSGELAHVCETLADFLETRQAIRDKATTALVYPAFVGAVALVVAGILLVNVAPEIVSLFEQTRSASSSGHRVQPSRRTLPRSALAVDGLRAYSTRGPGPVDARTASRAGRPGSFVIATARDRRIGKATCRSPLSANNGSCTFRPDARERGHGFCR